MQKWLLESREVEAKAEVKVEAKVEVKVKEED
jgi:hypothetical protein